MSTVDSRESVDSTGIPQTWGERDSEGRLSAGSDTGDELLSQYPDNQNVSGKNPMQPENTQQPTNAVIGADLPNVIGDDRDNVVAIAAQHNTGTTMSGIKNNLDTLDLRFYYGIDMIGVQDDTIAYLNGDGSNATAAPKNVNVINSSTGNVQKGVDYQANAAIFKIIKESIASPSETKNWDTQKGKDAHRARVAGTSFTSDGLGALNKELSDALAEAGKKGVKTISQLKLAAIRNPCTQIVFGYKKEGETVVSATGRIQSFTAGSGSFASVGTFRMERNEDGKYVITVSGDSSKTLLLVIGNLIGVNPKDIIVQQLVEKQDTTVVDASGATSGSSSGSSSNELPGAETIDVGGPITTEGNQSTSTANVANPKVTDPKNIGNVGGKRKTKRRKHKTLRSKAKKHRKTSKKHVKSHKKSHKKGKKH